MLENGKELGTLILLFRITNPLSKVFQPRVFQDILVLTKTQLTILGCLIKAQEKH
jgi:hypothetical protein